MYGTGDYVGLNEFSRNKMVHELNVMYFHKFKAIGLNGYQKLREKLGQSYPIFICLEIKDTIKMFNDNSKEGDGVRWDVPNRALPYLKVFTDFLVKGYTHNKITRKGLITDDDRLHSRGDMSFFTPIEDSDKRELVFRIYKVKT